MLEWNRPRCNEPKHDPRRPEFWPWSLLCPFNKDVSMKGYPEAELAREKEPCPVDATDLMRSRIEFPKSFKVIPFPRRVAYYYADFGLRPGFFFCSEFCSESGWLWSWS